METCVPLDSVEGIERRVRLVNRRAMRLGMPSYVLSRGRPELVWTLHGDARDGRPDDSQARQVPFVTLRLAGVDHLPEGGAVVSRFPGAPKVDLSAWTDRPPSCAHCRTVRPRTVTYLLTDGGEPIQVGSTCVRDFTGWDRDPARLLALAWEAGRALEGAGDGGCRSRYVSLRSYLPWVAACIRRDGWVSRRREDETGEMSTASRAMGALRKGREEGRPERRDHWTALRSIAWARRLQADSEYRTSLHVLATAGYFSGRHVGLAASMVAAYLQERERLSARRGLWTGWDSRAHAGEPGRRGTFRVRRLTGNPLATEGRFGPSYRYEFLDLESGALLVWWSSREACPGERGSEMRIRATVRRHERYRGNAQTVVSRVTVSGPSGCGAVPEVGAVVGPTAGRSALEAGR